MQRQLGRSVFSSHKSKLGKWEASEAKECTVCFTQTQEERYGLYGYAFPLVYSGVLLSSCEAKQLYNTQLEYPQLLKLPETHVALFINPELRYVVCELELEARLFLLNHSHVSLRYYEMGFLPMLKETADVSVPL